MFTAYHVSQNALREQSDWLCHSHACGVWRNKRLSRIVASRRTRETPAARLMANHRTILYYTHNVSKWNTAKRERDYWYRREARRWWRTKDIIKKIVKKWDVRKWTEHIWHRTEHSRILVNKIFKFHVAEKTRDFMTGLTTISFSKQTRLQGNISLYPNTTGLFISPFGISELDCATTKTDTAESSISIGRESLQVFFCTRGLGVLPGSTARG